MFQKLVQRIIAWASAREPHFTIGGRDRPYMRRWHVLPRNRFFNIYVHQILRDDDDRALHDHPFVNCSIILYGAYLEQRSDGRFIMRKPGNVVLRRATTAHRIILERSASQWSGAVWSLFLVGPRTREWGFHCPKGWVHWKSFVDTSDRGKIGRGCE